MLVALVNVYSLIVLAAVLLSWVPEGRDSTIGRFIQSVTEPLFERIRSVLPSMGGFDLSPMIVLFALQFLRRLLH